MTDRILDLSESRAYLRVELKQLVIEREDQKAISVPLNEVAVLILANPRITCTQGVLGGLMEAGGTLITCGQRNLPAGLMLSTQAHFTQAERFAAQASAPLPTKKRLWQQIVREKVRAQARLLREVRGGDYGLTELIRGVHSGDVRNTEAQAARRYWPALFNDDEFRRRREGDDQNRLLNYGYAVLRAVVGRAICAVGLHPSLGVHHHNRYNAFCLADDLMEPYRPVIDAVVVEHAATYGKDTPLDRRAKQALLGRIGAMHCSDGETRTLFDWAARTASSLAKVFLKEEERVFYPQGLEYAGE